MNILGHKLRFKGEAVYIKEVKMHLERCCITLRTWPSPVQKRQQPRLHCSNGSDRHSLPLRETRERDEPSPHNGWSLTKTRENNRLAAFHTTTTHGEQRGALVQKRGHTNPPFERRGGKHKRVKWVRKRIWSRENDSEASVHAEGGKNYKMNHLYLHKLTFGAVSLAPVDAQGLYVTLGKGGSCSVDARCRRCYFCVYF